MVDKQSQVKEPKSDTKRQTENEPAISEGWVLDAFVLQRAASRPFAASGADVLSLQEAYGNRAVTGLLTGAPSGPASAGGASGDAIQTKLVVGPIGDYYEREADRVAEQVMGTPGRPSAVSDPRSAGRVQRQEEEEELQTKPLAASITPLVQRQEEEELQMVPLQRQGEEELQMVPLQRQEEEELQMEPRSQEQADGGFQAGAGLEQRLGNSRGGGSPLPDETRAFMEPRFGVDFGGVRVHTDDSAAQMNQELNAQAFTHGSDIYVGASRYNPGSSDGKRLLAHELMHVVQQTGNGGLQRETVQRFMSQSQWVKFSSVRWSKRSALLKAIDRAVGAYSKVPESDIPKRLSALSALEKAIQVWEESKGGKRSQRQDNVDALKRDAQVERVALQMRLDQAKKEPEIGPSVPETPPEEELTPEEQEEFDRMEAMSLEELEEELAKEEEDEELTGLEGELGEEEKEAMDRQVERELRGESLDTLRALIMAQKVYIEGLKQQLRLAREMPPEQVEELILECQEQIDKANEISEILAQGAYRREEDEELGKELEDEVRQESEELQEDKEELKARAKLAKLEAEIEEEPALTTEGLGLVDPEDILDQLEEQDEVLGELEEEARRTITAMGLKARIVGAVYPHFAAYKAKKEKHGKHGIKSDRVQEIIDSKVLDSELGDFYDEYPEEVDEGIEMAARMAFGDVWELAVRDGYLTVINIESDAKLKAAAKALTAEINVIKKATPQELEAALEVMAQARVGEKVSGETTFGEGLVKGKMGSSGEMYGTVEGKGKVSAKIDTIAMSLTALAEASVKAGMGGDLKGFIQLAIGPLDASFETNLNVFLGAEGNVSAMLQITRSKIRAEAKASAFAGLKGQLGATAKIGVKQGNAVVDATVEGWGGAQAEAEGVFELGMEGIALKGKAGAKAGAGATAKGGFGFEYKGTKLFSITAKAEAFAGVAAQAEGEFTFKSGKLKISGSLATALGLGGELGTEVEIDFKEIALAIADIAKRMYKHLFPEPLDRRSPSGPRPTGLSEEGKGKLFYAVYPSFVAYGAKKQKQGAHGIKLAEVQKIIDNKVLRKQALVQQVGEGPEQKQVRFVDFQESDEILVFAAMSAFAGQLKAINVQAGIIRLFDAVSKKEYVGFGGQ